MKNAEGELLVSGVFFLRLHRLEYIPFVDKVVTANREVERGRDRRDESIMSSND